MEIVQNKTTFFKERVRGIMYAFLVIGVLEIESFLAGTVNAPFVRQIPQLFSGVILFSALYGLSNKQYRYYAQGALLGLLLYIVLSIGLRIVLKT